jgi:hypothetical protein
MASRVKTIEYAIPSSGATATVLGSVKQLTGTTNIYIPETGGTFAFKSAILQIELGSDAATGAAMTLPYIQFRLGTNDWSAASGVTPVATSAEMEEWTLTRDVTTVMTTQWSGIAMPWYVQVTVLGIATTNHSAKIIITYQYDDTPNISKYHMKTIRIPIESNRSTLTTTYQTVGGVGAIPAIGNFNLAPYLPETGITLRQVFVEMWGNSGTNAITNFGWDISVNGVTNAQWWRMNAAQNSAVWARAILDIPVSSTYLTGATYIQSRTTITTARMITVGGQIVVTYEYDPVASTRILNSLMLGAVDTAGWIGGITAATPGVWERSIYIEEPGALVMKQSGLCLWMNDSGTFNFLVGVTGDTLRQTGYTTYTLTAGALQCGAYSCVHRIDASGQTSQQAISLARGKNLYRVKFYSGTVQAGWNLSGYLLLNYISDKHLDGVGAHAHSVYRHIFDNPVVGGSRTVTGSTITPAIPESNYYLIGCLLWANYSPLGNGATGGLDLNLTIQAEITSGETYINGGAGGWMDIYNGQSRIDSENLNGYIYAAARTTFTRWNGDPDPSRLNFLTGRKYRIDSGPLFTGSLGMWYTYNNITYIVSGTCSGFSGDGSGIPIEIYRVVSSTADEQILNLTTVAGGTFTGTWVDNNDTLYAVARQDDTHVGRSKNGPAG